MPDNARPPDDAAPAVLIVNDEPHTLVALAAALDDGPWRVVTSGSGFSAFKRLLIEDYAVIVLDVQMPGGLDGFEVAKMIRERARTAATPIIFCTARAHAADDEVRGYGLGAVDYLHAPVSPTTLRAKVSIFVELYEQRRGLARAVAELERTRAALEARNRELQRFAERDGVTGTCNRHGFGRAVSPLFDAARRGEPFSLVAIGLDRLADVADAHGSSTYEACLRRVAWLVGAGLRSGDQLCRWRDEEFVLALGGTAVEEACEIAERLARRIREEGGPEPSGSKARLTLTASVGIASTAGGATTLDALVGQADAALRAARHAGGDRVQRHDRLPDAAPRPA